MPSLNPYPSFDLAVALRYLQALSVLAPRHAFARQILAELADSRATVAEYVQPIHTAPMKHLTPDEQLWRRTAEMPTLPTPRMLTTPTQQAEVRP